MVKRIHVRLVVTIHTMKKRSVRSVHLVQINRHKVSSDVKTVMLVERHRMIDPAVPNVRLVDLVQLKEVVSVSRVRLAPIQRCQVRRCVKCVKQVLSLQVQARMIVHHVRNLGCQMLMPLCAPHVLSIPTLESIDVYAILAFIWCRLPVHATNVHHPNDRLYVGLRKASLFSS